MVQTAQPQAKIGVLMMIYIVFKDANSLLLSFKYDFFFSVSVKVNR